jgi:hypothetical protein
MPLHPLTPSHPLAPHALSPVEPLPPIHADTFLPRLELRALLVGEDLERLPLNV